MALKEKFTNPAKIAFCNRLLDEIEKYGFGSMLKSDQDALLYYLMSTYINPGHIKNRHDWIDLLRVKPSILSSAQLTASVKFNKIADTPSNWLLVNGQLSNHFPEVQDFNTGTVVIYIDDAHVYRFLEWYLNNLGSSPYYQLNKTQLVVKYKMYLSFLEKISIEVGLDDEKIVHRLREDNSKGILSKQYYNISSLLGDLKSEVAEASISETTKKLLEYAGTIIIKFAKKQIGDL